VAPPKPTSFDLIVATVGRVEQVGHLLDSLERQTYRRARVIVVDQNEDDRLTPPLAARSLDILHLHSRPGLSHARNVGLAHAAADVVAFPDDDCEYPDDLLERVERRMAEQASLDGLTGRAADRAGRSALSWRRDRRRLTPGNLWNRANSCTIFLRRSVLERVAGFDEQLGLGARTPWCSGEEIELLVRALRTGAAIEYDPELVVYHELRAYRPAELRALGHRDGASVGYILRRHGYGPATIGPMLARPLGGAALALARANRTRASFHLATLRGRLTGLRASAK
jgi:glycosyltransferase involved in cell wall biosynthesis